jgi:hypothetical protein
VPSEWTVDTLKAHIDSQIKALSDIVALAFQAGEKAILKAEAAADKRADGQNEFRQTLSDQAATLMPRAETIALIANLQASVDRLEKVAATNAGREGISTRWIVGLVGVGTTIAGIVIGRFFH